MPFQVMVIPAPFVTDPREISGIFQIQHLCHDAYAVVFPDRSVHVLYGYELPSPHHLLVG